ncbi:hypothetical protein V6Z11_A13G249800 [Gossypium hirsutum]
MKKKRGREKGEGEGREFRPWAGHRSDCRTVAGPGAGHHARWPKKVPRAVEVTDGTVLQGCQRQVGVRPSRNKVNKAVIHWVPSPHRWSKFIVAEVAEDEADAVECCETRKEWWLVHYFLCCLMPLSLK